MAVEITCPKCKVQHKLTEALSGSRIVCTNCDTLIILDIKVERDFPKPVVKKVGPKIITPEIQGRLRSLAIQHLSQWLDVEQENISLALDMLDRGEAYESWRIPKGNSGRFRQITAPREPLKRIQRRILDRLLYRIPVSNAAHGFVQGRSIVTNAAYHLPTAREVLNLDLKDAFPSVDSNKVKHVFVRYLKIPLKHLGEEVPHEVLDEAIKFLVQLTTYNNSLPQGSATSGYILNIACIKLDKYIYRALTNNGNHYKFTRYADDITISSSQSIPQGLRQEIQRIVRECGFTVNPEKVSYATVDKGGLLEVTGLILEKGNIRIPRQKLESFRATIHQAAQVQTENLTYEKRLEIHSIVAFVSMVYKNLPPRILNPYREFLEKHHLEGIKRGRKPYLDLYPKATNPADI